MTSKSLTLISDFTEYIYLSQQVFLSQYLVGQIVDVEVGGVPVFLWLEVYENVVIEPGKEKNW